MLAAAQTGTGKTAAFIAADPRPAARARQHVFSPARHPVRVLILVPTRELAMQVDESVRTYGRTVPLRSTVVYGGIPMDPQIKALRAGVEILVATPGRLLDLVGQRVANLGQVEILVLDEADRMLDMGFLPDIQRIIALLPAKRQNLMFSATFSDDIRRLSGTILRDPAHGRGRAAEHDRRGGPPARLPGRSRPQGGAARPPRSGPTTCARSWSSRGPSSPRRGWPPGSTATASTRSAIHSRPLAARADARARGLQDRRDPGPRRHRRRRPRPRHRGPAGRRQLRAAVEPAGLHPPHRPDRPGRRDRRGDLARLHRRGRPAARHPAHAQAGHPVDGRGRLRPRSDRRGAASRDAGGPRPDGRSITRNASPFDDRVGSGRAAAIGVAAAGRGAPGDDDAPRLRATG